MATAEASVSSEQRAWETAGADAAAMRDRAAALLASLQATVVRALRTSLVLRHVSAHTILSPHARPKLRGFVTAVKPAASAHTALYVLISYKHVKARVVTIDSCLAIFGPSVKSVFCKGAQWLWKRRPAGCALTMILKRRTYLCPGSDVMHSV